MGKNFIITFAGDTSLGDFYVKNSGNDELIQRLENHPESFFSGVKPIIENSDHFIINLETVLADEPSIYFPDKKYPNWDKSEHLLKTLKNIGVTAVNMANNHTMDFGPEVMLETKNQLEKNEVQTFGAGNSLKEAELPLKITLVGENSIKNVYVIGGMRASKLYHEKYNFFAADDKPGVNFLDFNRISDLIKKIHNEEPGAYIILFPHWQGIDYKWASENKDIGEICSKFIENGVNYIIGHGPHIINHFEKRESAIVASSIGNFVWNAKGRYQKLQAPPYSAIGRLQFKEEEFDWSIESRFYPIVTDNSSTDYQTRAINENEFENLLEVLSEKTEGGKYSENAPNDFDYGKDAIGYYISPDIDNFERDLCFQNQKTDVFYITNIALQKPNVYKDETFSTNAVLAQEFEKKGYVSTPMENILIVQLGQENVVFIETESSLCSSVGARIAKDKTLAREFLKNAGLNIVRGKGFKTHEKQNALKYAMSLPASVIKPANGNRGRGISVGVKTKEEFENAWDNATEVTKGKILVEEQFIGGTEARYLVIGGCCVAVHLRIPPNIVGNGVDTIESLIKQKNEARSNNPNLNHILLKIDDHRLSIIKNQGYDLSSIPVKGVYVAIDWKGGLSTGGDSLDITDATHPLYKEIAEKAAIAIPGLDTVGVDIIAYNHSQEPKENNHIIVEVNTRPGIGGHLFPSYGKPRNVAKDIVEYIINRVAEGSGLMITTKTLIEAVGLTKNYYFKNVVDKNGKYIYSYLPDKNEKEKRYNILRHAGTTYSILETYELMPDEELLKTAEAAISFFIDKVKDFEINGNLVSAVIEKDNVKLGGNALGIIMLAKYTQITGNYEYLPLMQNMARWICEAQDKSGEFFIHKQGFSTNEIYNFTSEYYPGEAILSLVRLYQIDGNDDWLNSAEKAAQYLIEVRDKDADIDTIIHDHWLLYALNELYRERPQELYLNHVLLISKSIIKSQIIDNKEHPDWNGAYRIPHIRLESTPTACRSEGLCAAYNLFHDNGYDMEAARIKTAIEEGIRFQLQTQLRPESVVNYENKDLCLGAFQQGLNKYDLRIDYTQHNISSLIGYYKILSRLN